MQREFKDTLLLLKFNKSPLYKSAEEEKRNCKVNNIYEKHMENRTESAKSQPLLEKEKRKKEMQFSRFIFAIAKERGSLVQTDGNSQSRECLKTE